MPTINDLPVTVSVGSSDLLIVQQANVTKQATIATIFAGFTNDADFITEASADARYLTQASAGSFLTAASLVPYLTQAAAASTYITQTSATAQITAALTPYITQTSANSAYLAKTSSGAVAGIYGSTTRIPVITVNGYGIITSVATVAAATSGGGGGGSGNVSGPGSSSDNAIVRFDGTSGTTIQNSGVIIGDGNNMGGVTALVVCSTSFPAGVIQSGVYVASTSVNGNLATGIYAAAPTGAVSNFAAYFSGHSTLDGTAEIYGSFLLSRE